MLTSFVISTVITAAAAIEPFKVWSPAYPVEGSQLSACQYGSVQSERVSSGDFKVVLPSLPPNIQLDSVGFGFNFAVQNPSCHLPTVLIQDPFSLETNQVGIASTINDHLRIDGLTHNIITNDLILRIPEETTDCDYELKSATITLFLPTYVAENHCHIGNVLNMIPNEDFQLPQGETDSYSMESLKETNDPPHGDSMHNLKETRAQSDEIINNLHLQKKTVLSMVQELADHGYAFLLNEQPEEGKERRREVYEMFHRVFDKVQEFATGNLQKPNEALSAIKDACKSLSSARFGPKRITVSQFTIILGHKLPSGLLPISLMGIKVVDGVENFVKYDYPLIWKQMSKQEKNPVRYAYETLVTVYNHIKPFADDMTVRAQVESATETACSYINFFIEDPQQHLD